MPFRAILFDLDGTLLDTLADIAHAANEALAREGCPARSEAEFRRFVGDGIATTLRRALPTDRADDPTVARCVAGFQEAYGRSWNVRTRLYAGIHSLLDELRSRDVGLAVLSNKADDFTRRFGASYLAAWPFRAVVGLREGVPKKPDPTSALEIAAGLGVDPADCLFVGDSAVDIETGHAAGMVPVGVSWGFQPVAMLVEAQASAIIDHPRELLAIVDRGRGG